MTDIVVPAEQEGTRAVVKAWLKKVGDPVRVDDPVVELETDKVAVEVAAAASGTLSEILVADGAEVEPGTVLGRIADGAARPVDKAMAQGAGLAAPKPGPAEDASRLPPGLRKLLAEHNLAAADVPHSGGRLTREDILAEAARRAKPAPGVRRIPHDSMRKRIAEHMAQSVRTAPHVTAMFEADFTAIMAHRAAHRAAFEKEGANLTFTAYFVAASAAAMKAAPAVNGRWHEDRIEIPADINIGVGTALGEKGLIVPVIHRAQALSLCAIAGRLTELTEKARAGSLAPADVRDGTFSISNHGVSGSLLAAPIVINQPQSAILGVGKLQKRAVVREGGDGDRIEIRPMCYVTLTIDHRVIDAHQTNAWLTRFVETLESWPVEGA
ncbi:MAG TPA: 2-oxo acid dehydrogenase subunit E2 [Rhizomicrobium sp.]|nr:2-oxo acid dehydrogenase subunit E2 [Rhizomicrobium sp.]